MSVQKELTTVNKFALIPLAHFSVTATLAMC